jgi:hypothetical protein
MILFISWVSSITAVDINGIDTEGEDLNRKTTSPINGESASMSKFLGDLTQLHIMT